MDTLTAYVLFVSTVAVFLYSLKKLVPRLVSWQLTNRYSIQFDVESVGLFNLRGLHVHLPENTTLFVARVHIGSSLANWLLPTKFKRPFVLLLDGATLTFQNDFGSRIMHRNISDSCVPAEDGFGGVAGGWQKDVLSFLFDNKEWVQRFVWSIEMSDVTVRTSHFEMSIETAFFESKWKEHILVLNNSYVKSLFPLTVDDINSDSNCRRILEVSYFKFTFNRIQKEHHYVFREEIYGQWTPLFHLNVMNVVNSVKAIIRTLRKSHAQPSSPSDRTALLYFEFMGRISIGCLLSNEGQSMELRAGDFSVVRPAKQRLSIKSNSIVLLCDENEIAFFDTIQILYLPESECSSVMSRDDFIGANFVMKKNRVLSLAFGKIRIAFPYKYDFADTFNERFITMTKWLRQLHGKKNKSENVAFDVSLDVGRVTMELEDDPFEVKLRSNYQLLEDEHAESERRQQALEETIEKLRAGRKMTDKIANKMRLELEAKKHEIYIKRHCRGYQFTRNRKLFQVQADCLSVKLAADITLSSQEKMIRIIRTDLDPVSPFPEDLRFSTMWCRQILASISSLVCRLRDFPQPMMEMKKLCMSGRILGAEQEAGLRSRRLCFVDMGPEAAGVAIERTMPSLKIYHDVKWKTLGMTYCHGATWDPILAQLSLCFEKINKPSRDPSPSLPWWDKMRHIFHGRLIIESQSLSLFFHASLDPYNSTELIEIAFTKSSIDWLIGKILIKGNIDLLLHTASKYDECKIVQLPNTSAQIYLNWDCIGNPYDHHSAVPCAPDKLPEYSSNQQHDSYRAFRSQSLNVKLSLESRSVQTSPEIPAVLLYSNSIRWFENQKQIFAGMTRLTRRGKLFDNVKPRKIQFSRLFRKIQVSVMLHKFKAMYWSSSNQTYGCEILGENLSHSAEHVLSLVLFKSELKRRPQPVWNIAYMNSEITKLEIWLHSNKAITSAEEEDSRGKRMYLLSISRVSYNRDSPELRIRSPESSVEQESQAEHRLVVHDLRGAWTIINKEVAFALFDLYVKAQVLKKNLSTEALKGLKMENQSGAAGTSPFKAGQESLSGSKTSLNKNYAASMLKKLIAESESNPNVEYSEDIENELISDEVRLRGMSACQDDDLIHNNWLIELVNSQVVLRGCETSGYVIASAAKCQIWQKVHKPVWKERTLLSKGTWVGSVESMQYYATVDAKIDSDVVWLPLHNIQDKDSLVISDLTELVGSGQRVGGVLSLEASDDVAVSGEQKKNGVVVQLQRIISRCSCQFYYVCFTDDLDMDIIREIPPMPEDNDLIEPWDKEVAVDSFTLMHTELDVSTNSQQYAMIIDLVNNLLLYVEPHRKEAVEKMENMRFQFQLTSLEEQREPISLLQDSLRKLVRDLKQSERDCYRLQRPPGEVCDLRLEHELESEKERSERLKAEINEKSDDLAMRISCFKEAQLLADKDRERQEALASGHFVSSVVKRIEVCFRQASWVLTDADGQLQLADITLRNFLYTKIAKNDDSVEHLLELGFIQVFNRLPNQAYATVLEPTNLAANIPLDRRHALRIFCRERPPVAGIPVKEHFEVNVVPMTIAVTKAFFKRMVKFFFPEPEEEEKPAEQAKSRRMLRRKAPKKEENVSDGSSIASAPSQSSTATKQTTPAPARKAAVTDVQKMRERAQKNQTFVYIKIPEVPITVSYKGGKANHISAIDNFTLILPTIEYHNQTWTWFDVLMAIKNESQKRLLPQAVKQKLTIWPTSRSSESRLTSQDRTSVGDDTDRKMRLLLGDAGSPMPSRGSRFTSLFRKQ